MPELPEVETTRRGIQKVLTNAQVKYLIVRDRRLRWPVPDDLEQRVEGQNVVSITRRAKYILIELDNGYLIWHLGMSGSLRIVDEDTEINKHDHIDLVLKGGKAIRFNDPRRFGCLLWGGADALTHSLLAALGPEPLGQDFDGEYLYRKSRGRKIAIKTFIMDQKIVVGVGNIYASEALFSSGILPTRQACRISLARYQALAGAIKYVLNAAIKQGGTTLQDFQQADGKPGYFKQALLVYGREGEQCEVCGEAILNKLIGQRASFYCPACQH
jgi:formamidopyrimidine-DNA glycosylase